MLQFKNVSKPSKLDIWLKRADFFTKTIIATATVLVSACAMYLTYSETHRANAQKALADAQSQQIARRNLANNDDKAVRENAEMIISHAPADQKERLNYVLITQQCSNLKETSSYKKHFSAICEAVSQTGKADQDNNASKVTAEATSAIAGGRPQSYLTSQTAISQNVAMTAAEGAKPASAEAQWYAVVGTLPQSASKAVEDLAKQLNVRLYDAGLPRNDVHVYRTQISKSFALTSGKAKSKEDAQKRVQMLKKAGFSDAFAQVDRGWTPADDLRGP